MMMLSSVAGRAQRSLAIQRPLGLIITQERQRWTKAKKKRFARYERRQRLEAAGIPVSIKPPIPPVVNAVDREALEAQQKIEDSKMAAEMDQKLQAREPALRLNFTADLRMSDRVRRLFDLQNGNQSEVIKAQKKQGMELFQMRPGDTGSSSVQVVALTTRIQQVQKHLQMHPKDKHGKRGLGALYVRRRKLLDYMERKDFSNYRRVVKTLGLTRK